jgi:hypothetical protein
MGNFRIGDKPEVARSYGVQADPQRVVVVCLLKPCWGKASGI